VDESPERYVDYYSDRIWSLVPAYYRELDGAAGDVGPLQALVGRIAKQAAILRTSLDRLWEDQSIESSDDWVIPYIGDLVATRLVAGLDSRGKRLDVFRTIHYRRRKGTLPVLEQIASDITGWEARVVEFFRHMGRTRHGLDPEIGFAPLFLSAMNPDLRYSEGLVGRLTGTSEGGYANVRSVYGAGRIGSSFDEFAYTADVRAAKGRRGWYLIPRLGVFLWRLTSFHVIRATPVRCSADVFTFDPTGRGIQLFARRDRTQDSFGEEWVSPEEWQLPGPIDELLLKDQLSNLYPTSIEIRQIGTVIDSGLPADQVTIYPRLGTFRVAPGIASGRIGISYCYGFPSRIGAGPYDRRVLGESVRVQPQPVRRVLGGGADFATKVAAAGLTGTLEIQDSLTYQGAPDVNASGQLEMRAANRQRPLIRASGQPWVISGPDQLVLDGLFISGRDLILRGDFDQVSIVCCTFDPGGASGATGKLYQRSVDGVDLVPARIWVEKGIVKKFVIDRSVLASVRTRNGGVVEHATVTDSTFQSIPTTLMEALTAAQVLDAGGLAARLRDFGQPGVTGDALSTWLYGKLSAATKTALNSFVGSVDPPNSLVAGLVTDLEKVIEAGSIYDPVRFARIPLTPAAIALATGPAPADIKPLNRLFLAQAYPMQLDDLAIGLGVGMCQINRCTLDGRSYFHRLQADECIFADRVLVEDTQHGCFRFSARAESSIVPRQYESVQTSPGSQLFTSRKFGNAAYLQLSEGADLAITSGTNTITAGGPEGSEMGSYARELYPIKRRGLLLKFDEYMPLGLEPVIVNVT
jgi:hypothetical protein